MKNTNKIISAFCVVFLLLCFVGCDETIKDNSSEQQNSSVLQQLEIPSNFENNVTNNNNDIQTNSSTDNIQYLPDDFVNNTDSDGVIESGELEDNSQNEQSQNNNSSNNNNSSESNEKIEYDDNVGWSSGWN